MLPSLIRPGLELQLVMARRRGPDCPSRPAQADEAPFIRKGEVGDWKNYMSEELVGKFDAWTETNLAGTGLIFQ